MVVYFFLLCCSSFLQLNASIQINCTNIKHEQKSSQHSPELTAIQGKPFTLEIHTEGSIANKPIDQKQLPKTCRILSSGKSTSINMFNGTVSSKTTHSFTLIPEALGTFSIGPFKIEDIESNQLSITVRAPTDTETLTHNNHDDYETDENSEETETQQIEPSLFAKISSSIKQAFVGEPFIVSRIIYHRGPIRKTEFEALQSPNAHIKQLPGRLERKEILHGKEYTATEEQYLVTAKKAGSLQIPAQRFLYLYTPIQRKHSSDPFSFFLQNFMPFELHQDQGIVPETAFIIKNLPKQSTHVDAIGSFTGFTITINKTEIPLNNTVEISIQLKGFAQFDDIATPELILPFESNTYAPSQKTIQEITVTTHEGIKEFTYIIQPTEAGIFTIPSQCFRFFNPQTKKIEELSTEPLTLTVKKSKPDHPSPAVKENNQTKKDSQINDQETDGNTLLLLYTNELPSRSFPHIPWALFSLLFLIPLLFLRTQLQYYITWKKKKKPEEQLLEELYATLNKNQYAHAHTLIKKIFGLHMQIPETLVTETKIEQALDRKNIPFSEITSIKNIYLQTLIPHKQIPSSEEKNKKIIMILKKLFLCILLICSNSRIHANQDKIKEYIQDKKYQDAYKEIIKKTNKAPHELLTAGELAHTLNKTDAALFWFTEAQKNIPSSYIFMHRYLLKNKQKLYAKEIQKGTFIRPLTFLTKNIFISSSILLWQILLLFLWIVGILLLLKKYTRKKIGIWIISLCITGALLSKRITLQNTNNGILLQTTTLYAGPEKNYDIITTLPENTYCTILQKTPSFFKINNKDTEGWVEKENLGCQ